MAVKHLQIPQNRFSDANKQIRFRMLLREIENFQILWESPEIVDFYGFCLHNGQALICMELMDMSLKDFYSLVHTKYGEKFEEKFIGFVAVKIVDALDFCKKKGVIHRDIKPSNILVGYK
jgi:serine/threonine protein kinase